MAVVVLTRRISREISVLETKLSCLNKHMYGCCCKNTSRSLFVSSDCHRNWLQIKEIHKSSDFCSERSVIRFFLNLCLGKSD